MGVIGVFVDVYVGGLVRIDVLYGGVGIICFYEMVGY